MITAVDKERNRRKMKILASFHQTERQYTNQIARELDVTWPVADRLLRRMVGEKLLDGDKVRGYTLHGEATTWERIKRLFHARKT